MLLRLAASGTWRRSSRSAGDGEPMQVCLVAVEGMPGWRAPHVRIAASSSRVGRGRWSRTSWAMTSWPARLSLVKALARPGAIASEGRRGSTRRRWPCASTHPEARIGVPWCPRRWPSPRGVVRPAPSTSAPIGLFTSAAEERSRRLGGGHRRALAAASRLPRLDPGVPVGGLAARQHRHLRRLVRHAAAHAVSWSSAR